jgi:hypothetical protein
MQVWDAGEYVLSTGPFVMGVSFKNPLGLLRFYLDLLE